MSTIESKAIKGVSWLAIFKFVSQIFSWAVTILIARILLPGDYGLMAMSTIITSYAEMFSELGLGAAIIQRRVVEKDELSSIFWFGMGVAFILATFCFVAAPVTAAIFKDPRVIPLTQAVSVLFLLSGLQIVPLNLLKKELNFKNVGFIEMVTTVLSCIGMLVIAKMGGGVWALLGGRIIRGVIRAILLYCYVDWWPRFYFQILEAKSYLRFGLIIAIGQSFFYLFSRSDVFFAGRVWSAQVLGLYTFAILLAEIPTEKIVSLINQVSFSAFAKLQDDEVRFKRFYLRIVKLTSTLVLPIFVGGFLVGDSIVRIVLDEKWLLMADLFRFLCLSQIFTSLNAVNNFVHNAKGRPHLGIYINAILLLSMSVAYYFTVPRGLNAILIPWLTVYVVICCGWIFFTARVIGVRAVEYIRNIYASIIATSIMILSVLFVKYLLSGVLASDQKELFQLLICVLLGGMTYIGTIFRLDQEVVLIVMKIIRREKL